MVWLWLSLVFCHFLEGVQTVTLIMSRFTTLKTFTRAHFQLEAGPIPQTGVQPLDWRLVLPLALVLLLVQRHTLTCTNMWPLVRSSICVKAPFTTARLHRPMRSNQAVSLSAESHLCVNGLCCSHMITGVTLAIAARLRQGQVRGTYRLFLIQIIIAWFSNVLKCKGSGLCGDEYFQGLLSERLIVSQQG